MAEKEKVEEQEVSRYNEASFQISRLHELWLLAEAYAHSGQSVKWKNVLDGIWRELYAGVLKLPGDGKKDIIKREYSSKKRVAEAISENNRNKLYFSLDMRHRFLKHIQELLGKGGSYASSLETDYD